MVQESALCAENNATVERLIAEGQAQHKPLALATMYAASKRVQVSFSSQSSRFLMNP